MELAVPVIPADDISQAKQFYIDKLGFQLTFETESLHDDRFRLRNSDQEKIKQEDRRNYLLSSCKTLLISCYLRLSIFSSASLATISGPADAARTPLSIWRILPSGAI